MPEHAKRPAGTGRGGGLGHDVDTNIVAHRTQNPDAVATWYRTYRDQDETTILAAKAHVVSTLAMGEQEIITLNDHDYILLGWQLDALDGVLRNRERRRQIPAGTQGGFDREFVQSLRSQVPCHELIIELGDPLRRAGNSWRGACPICDASNQSTLSATSDFWKCFRCNAGGDVISWITMRWGQSFPEAVRTLASIAGIAIPDKRRAGAA